MLIIIMLLSCSGFLIAQESPPPVDNTRKDALRIFIDCRRCDMDYIREVMPFINYVREIREAQLYLLVTQEHTGSGGTRYTLFFSGQQEFSGMDDILTYVANPDDTDDITRIGLTKTMGMGLMRYVAKTPIRDNVIIRYEGEPQENPEQVSDRWNFWVFEIEIQPEFSIEQSRKGIELENSFEANMITPDWKLENEFEFEYELDVFIKEPDDNEGNVETRTEAERKSWEFENLTVKSLNDHWSAGLRSEISSSSYRNLDIKIQVSPAIEYNIFPYSLSNQKQLRILYGLGFVYNNYVDTTVYNQIEENLFEHSLDLALQVQQSWGSANISLGYSNYLHDFSKNRIQLNGYVQVRILRGLSISLDGDAALIHNQIELARGGRSDEEVYLRLRELETNYRFGWRIGITYTFGSIFNNIVNPRF